MSNRKKSSFFIKVLNLTTILYIVSLFSLTSHETLYMVNRVLFFVLFALFSIVVLRRPEKINFGKIIVSFMPILILIILSNIWAVDISVSLNRTIGIIFYSIGAIIIYLLIYNKYLSLEHLSKGFLGSMLVLSISASYEYYFLGISRAGGLAGNPNTFGLNIVFIAPLLWTINKMKMRESKMINWIIILSLVNASIVSGGRKVLIASILILIFFYLNKSNVFYKSTNYLRFALTAMMGTFLILLLLLNLDYVHASLGNLNALNRMFDTEEASYLIRKDMIETSIVLFKEKPLLGYGIDNYSVLSRYGTYSHNNYTELLVGTGILGILLYYYVYVKIFKYSNRIRKLTNNFKLLNFTLFYLILILIMEFALVNIYRPSIWIQLISIVILNEHFYKTSTNRCK